MTPHVCAQKQSFRHSTYLSKHGMATNKFMPAACAAQVSMSVAESVAASTTHSSGALIGAKEGRKFCNLEST